MEITHQDLETSLIETIGSDLPSLVIDAGELLLDDLLKDGLLKDIPIVGSIFKVAKAGIDIKNYLFIKKLLLFLTTISDMPPQKRKEFAEKMERNPKQMRRVGQNLLLLIDRLDDFAKPDMLGRVFKSYLQGEIDYSVVQRLCVAIDRVNTQHLDSLTVFYEQGKQYAEDYALQDLAFAGLVSIDPSNAYIGGGGGGYTPNDLGKVFLRHAIEKA